MVPNKLIQAPHLLGVGGGRRTIGTQKPQIRLLSARLHNLASLFTIHTHKYLYNDVPTEIFPFIYKVYYYQTLKAIHITCNPSEGRIGTHRTMQLDVV